MNEIEKRSVVISRDLPFARERIWTAMTHPDHVNRWWGPDGFRNEDVVMDFHVGGLWSYTMVGPDGTRYPNRVWFKELTPPARLVFDHGDDQRVWFETTVTLEPTDTGTRVTILQVFPTQAERDEVVEKYGAIEGGQQHLAKLEAYVRDHLA